MVTTTAAATTVNMLACHHPNAVTTIQQPSTTKFSHPLVELAEKQHDEDLLFFCFQLKGCQTMVRQCLLAVRPKNRRIPVHQYQGKQQQHKTNSNKQVKIASNKVRKLAGKHVRKL